MSKFETRSVKQMQETLHCSRRTVLQIASEADAIFRCGRRIFIIVPKVENFMNNNTIGKRGA